MLRYRLLAALALAAGLAGSLHAQRFAPTPTPDKGGVRAVVDLPASQHMRNVGGSDGAGLCVFTSLQHSARWQNLIQLEGYRAWMQRRPGGGYPSKVDATLKAFCQEKGIAVPSYIQHTGGEADFLDLAIHTGRCPAVTYDGRDDFYRGQVAHMVTLAHIDADRAAIIDNNRPGAWVWMSRADFLARWRGNGGGWAVVFLDPPPPPHPANPTPLALPNPNCKCAPECDCWDGCECGKKKGAERAFGQCANGRCPVVTPGLAVVPLVAPAQGAGPAPIGSPPTPAHEWGVFPDGRWGWRFKVSPPTPAPAPEPAPATAADPPTGVMPDPNPPAEYSHTGRVCSRSDALAALVGSPNGLEDDSGRWHLAAVGPAEFLSRVRADVAALPAADRGKLLATYYAPAAWQVAHFQLPGGVVLRRPAVDRVGATLGAVTAADYTAAKLADLIGCPGGPNPRPAPPPAPKQPDPPAPGPEPSPAGPPPAVPVWVFIVGALAALYFLTKRKDG